jgi:antitoxin CptB
MPASHSETSRAETPGAIRRKRLLFRSWHRGTREADLILGSFAEAYLASFDEIRLDEYESLLACPDAEVFDWLAGRSAPPPEFDTEVTRLLLAFRYTPRAT